MNGLRLRSNPATLLAYRNLTQTQFGLNNTLQRLSSGLRINKAADDSAGSAVSTRMNNQILGMKQANENSQQANNLIQMAESGLNDISGMLSRMRELATQAATDTLNANDRTSINLEFQALKNEISRVAHATEYNEMNLLNGTDYKNEVHRINTTADDVIGINIKNANLSHDVRKGIYTLSDEHIDVSGLADISKLSDTAITGIRYSSSSIQPALGETYTIKSQVNSGLADIDSLSSTSVSQLRHSTSPIVLPGDHTISARLDASDHANISGLSGTAITEIRHNASSVVQPGDYTISSKVNAGTTNISNVSGTSIVHSNSPLTQPGFYTVSSKVNAGTTNISNVSGTSIIHSNSPLTQPGFYTVSSKVNAGTANISNLVNINKINHNASIQPGVYSINSQVNPNTIAISQAAINHTSSASVGNYVVSAKVDAGTADISNLSGTSINQISHQSSVQPGVYTLQVASSNSSGTTFTYDPALSGSNRLLTNDFLTVGINHDASLINTNLGNTSVVFDPDGTSGPKGPSGDFFYPGTPLEGFSVKYEIGGSTQLYRNAAPENSPNISFNVRDHSTATHQVSVANGTTPDGNLEIEQVVSLEEGSRVLRFDLTFKNVGSQPISNLKYLRNADPDQDRGPHGTTNTFNDTLTLASGEVAASAVGEISGYTVVIGSVDKDAVVSAGRDFKITDPDIVLNSPNDPNGGKEDNSINVAKNLMGLPSGATKNMTFFYTFGENKNDALSTLDHEGIPVVTMTVTAPDGLSESYTHTQGDSFNGKVALTNLGIEMDINNIDVLPGQLISSQTFTIDPTLVVTAPDTTTSEVTYNLNDTSADFSDLGLQVDTNNTSAMTNALLSNSQSFTINPTLVVTAPDTTTSEVTYNLNDTSVDFSSLGIDVDTENAVNMTADLLNTPKTFTINPTLEVTPPVGSPVETDYSFNSSSQTVDFPSLGIDVDTENAVNMTADLLNTPKTFTINPTLEVTPPVGSPVETDYSFNSNSQTVDFSSLGIEMDTGNAANTTAILLDSFGEFTVNARLTAVAPDGTHQEVKYPSSGESQTVSFDNLGLDVDSNDAEQTSTILLNRTQGFIVDARLTATAPDGTYQEIKYSSSGESQTVSFDNLGLDVDSNNAQITANQLLDNSKDFTVNPTLAVNSPNTGPMEEIGYQFHSNPQTIDFSRLGLEVDTNEAPKTTTTLLGSSQDFFVPETRKLTMTGENGLQQSLEYRVGYDTTLNFDEFGIQLEINGSPDHSTPSIDSYNPHTDSLNGKQIEISPNRDLQVGFDNDVNHQLKLGITSVTASGLEIEDESVADINQARSAITSLDMAIDVVNQERSYLASEQNRLAFTMSNLTNQTQNIEISRSNIQDADFASDAASLAKNQILTQSTTAMLAQANSISQNIISLITV